MNGDRGRPVSDPPRWRSSDGEAIACEEKLKVLNENLDEIRQICQDAFEDAILIGCDEDQVRQTFARVIGDLVNPFRER